MTDLFKLFAEAPELLEAGAMELMVEDFVSDVETGSTEAFKKAVQLKAVEKFLSEAKAKLQEKVLLELDQENNRQYAGFNIYKTTAPTRYKYNHNEDWAKLDQEAKKIAKQKKELETKMILAFKQNISIIDEVSGEVYPPAKYSSGGQETFVIK